MSIRRRRKQMEEIAEAAIKQEAEVAEQAKQDGAVKQGIDAFRSTLGQAFVMASTVLYENMRHVVTLYPGAIVGEIALLKDGTKRMATVRASDTVDLLVIDKKAFLDLDKATLNIIREQARYNAACAKTPAERTKEDLRTLQQRTSVLNYFANLGEDTHLELCRVMNYRKLQGGTILVRKGMPVQHLNVIISGQIATFATNPKRQLSFNALAGGPSRNQDANTFLISTTPTEILHVGRALGEEELLADEESYKVTAVASEPVELMEIAKEDFDRIVKAERHSMHGMTLEFMANLPCMKGCTSGVMRGLLAASIVRNYTRDQVCIAYPPSAVVSTASFSQEHVYVIRSGEAQLCGVPGTAAVTANQPSHALLANAHVSAATAEAPHGTDQAAEWSPPPTSIVQRYMGGVTVPVATLGQGECITENLLAQPSTRWYLRATGPLQMVVIPRKEWSETLGPTKLKQLHELARTRATFFQSQLEQVLLLPPSATPNAHVRRLLARPSSAPVVKVSVGPHRAPLPRPQQSMPGAFVRGGLGHGVVVPPRGATRPLSESSGAQNEKISAALWDPTKTPKHRPAPSASSPNLRNLQHWLVELETNPAYRAAHDKKRRPGSAASLRARGDV